jgi:hypothetical protein
VLTLHSCLIISFFSLPIAVGEALDVIGMQEVQLPTPADSSCCFCKAESETVALFRIQLMCPNKLFGQAGSFQPAHEIVE